MKEDDVDSNMATVPSVRLPNQAPVWVTWSLFVAPRGSGVMDGWSSSKSKGRMGSERAPLWQRAGLLPWQQPSWLCGRS